MSGYCFDECLLQLISFLWDVGYSCCLFTWRATPDVTLPPHWLVNSFLWRQIQWLVDLLFTWWSTFMFFRSCVAVGLCFIPLIYTPGFHRSLFSELLIIPNFHLWSFLVRQFHGWNSIFSLLIGWFHFSGLWLTSDLIICVKVVLRLVIPSPSQQTLTTTRSQLILVSHWSNITYSVSWLAIFEYW